MPKKVDSEHDPMRRNDLEALESAANPFDTSARDETPQAVEGVYKPRELTQREAARLKRKQALEAKIQQNQSAATGDRLDLDDRESKKIKANSGVTSQTSHEQPSDQGDVEMKDNI